MIPGVSMIHILILSGVLFTLGALGVLIRRNAIVMFMSIELMLNAANLAFVGFARSMGALSGQVFVFFCHRGGRRGGGDWTGADCRGLPQPRQHRC